MRNESDIDNAIDRAVRDIMHAEPRAGFRGRVLGRLRATGRGEGSWLTPPRVAAAMAVLAIAIAIGALLRTHDPQAPANTPVVAQKEPPVPTDVRPVTPPAPAPAEAGTNAPAARPRREPAVAFPPPGTVTAASVPPDATPPPVRPAPGARSELIVLTPAPLVIAPLIVPPIVIPPIVIQPNRTPR
jgi:hypothetical protein